MSRDINVICWNFEENGAGKAEKRQQASQILAQLQPSLLLRQEMWDAGANGNTILHEQANSLGLRPCLGERSCTAVFVDPQLFAPVREWPDAGLAWNLPPTALTLRYRHAGAEAVPLNVVSYHLNYCNPYGRSGETQELTRFADKKWNTPRRSTARMPVLMGGDHNSYPRMRAENELPLPQLEDITDLPHRAHRFRPGPDGTLTPDTDPDDGLRLAGLEDLAWHWATADNGDPSALTHTVNDSLSHGPRSRIDRVYASKLLMPALRNFEVIEVEPEISDHHILRAVFDADALAEILNAYAQV